MKIFYAQSGGVTTVINATLAGLVTAARNHEFEVCLGIRGIKGLLQEEWLEASQLSEEDLAQIALTPGGSFGSCRYSVSEDDCAEISKKLLKHGFDAIVYQGGNDSQLTLLKIAQALQAQSSKIICLGIPKTIDNDLPVTAFCPGFLSSAEFLIRGFRGACLDVQSMCQDSTKVFIVETMGRHTGWLTAACGLSNTKNFPGPAMILIPEMRLPLEAIEEAIRMQIQQDGFCAIAVSEGYSPELSAHTDAFGHAQLEGSGLSLKSHIEKTLKLKTRLCVPDYFQRSFIATVNSLDWQISQKLGHQAIDYLKSEKASGKMLAIFKNTQTLEWDITHCPLEAVAGKEQPVPSSFLEESGWMLSAAGQEYFHALLAPSLFSDRILRGLQHLWPHYLRQTLLANQ